jgi:hypothetical protein
VGDRNHAAVIAPWNPFAIEDWLRFSSVRGSNRTGECMPLNLSLEIPEKRQVCVGAMLAGEVLPPETVYEDD